VNRGFLRSPVLILWIEPRERERERERERKKEKLHHCSGRAPFLEIVDPLFRW
jgi:hypothetical protein